MSVIALDGMRLRDDFEDKEPRIRDLELAKRLGYARPRDIRKLIERLEGDGLLSDFAFCATVARSPGERGRPGSEFWLDEPSALAVILKSETEAAHSIFREVVAVFIAYRRGKLMPRLLAAEPCEWDAMWTDDVKAALCRLYGQPSGPRFPRFLASVIQRLYKLVLEPATYVEMKERNPDPRFGSNHHQLLTEQARDRFRKELVVIEGTALSSDSVDEFWARLERVYLGHPMQLRLMGTESKRLTA